MKGKTLLGFGLVLLMTLVLMPSVTLAQLPTTLEIEPPVVDDKLVCEDFRVAVHITDVELLWSWAMDIEWNPAVLECTGCEEGPFMKSEIPTFFAAAPPNNTSGEIPEISCTSMATSAPFSVSGSGDLLYVDFHVKAIGDSDIIITHPDFLDENYQTIVLDEVTNGFFTLPPPPPKPPEADFTITPEEIFVCDTVTLDASPSKPGWDTLPDPGHSCPVTSWHWVIDFKNGIIWEPDTQVVVFHCDAPGFVDITLTVDAPDPTLPTHPEYSVWSLPVTKTIYQKSVVVGPEIDVYTEKGGEGPGIDPATGEPMPYPLYWSDAFGPQEEVTVCALVTYNKEPVEYKPVAFEIQDPSGTGRDYRTAFTNAEGIACVDFRIPWEGSDAEDMFGDWTIVATADIAETVVMDIVKFKFGYILSIDNIVVTGSPLKKCNDLGVSVHVENIAMTSKNVRVAVVLYDECGVPIGIGTVWTTADPETITIFDFTIHIPTWAFVGEGTVYVNLFTAKPSNDGVPYCPEKDALFTILNTADP